MPLAGLICANVPTIFLCLSVAASDEGGSQPVFGSPRRQFHGHRCLTSFEVVAQFGPPAGICTSEDLLGRNPIWLPMLLAKNEGSQAMRLASVARANSFIPSTPAEGIPVCNTELNLSARTLLKGGRRCPRPLVWHQSSLRRNSCWALLWA